MKCNNCGKKLRIDDKFCSKCGTQIDWTKESYDVVPEDVKETRGKKASKWIGIGIAAAIGIAAVFTIAIVGNAVHKNVTTQPTDVASETSVETETAAQTETTETPTTEQETAQRRKRDRETEASQPETTAPELQETTRSRENSRGNGWWWNDSGEDSDSREDNSSDGYGYYDDYDYDKNYADGWRRATDDYENNGVADDIWDYLRTQGGQLRDSYEYGQQSVYDAIEGLRGQFF